MVDKIKKILQSKNFLLGLIFVGVFLIGLSGTYLILSLTEKAKPREKITKEVLPTEKPFEPINIQDSYNMVLFGSGGEGHSGGGLTDSIIIVHGEIKNKRVALISIPRDLWVPGNYKINASSKNVGLENTKGVIQNVTGLHIDNYVQIDFSGIIKLIDTLGGIEVNVVKTYDDYFYPVKGLENETCGKTGEEIASLHQKYSGFELEKQFTCRYEHIHFDKGITKIDGETALKLARSRHGDSDFGRSARQFVILKGILQKLISLDALGKASKTVETLYQIVKTDLDLKTIGGLIETIGNPEEYEITQIHLTDENVLSSSKSSDGQYILIPKAGINNFSGIKSYITQ